MNKKTLPKAIRQLPGDMREPDAVSGALEHRVTNSTPAQGPAEKPTIPANPNAVGVASAPRSEAMGSSSNALMRRDGGLSDRRRLAEAIVERHANYSAVGGIIPLPLINFGAVTAIIVRMVRALSSVYGVPFERDRARVIVVSSVAGSACTRQIGRIFVKHFESGATLVDFPSFETR